MNKIFYKKETYTETKYELLKKKYTNWNTCCGQIVFCFDYFLNFFPLLQTFGILSKSDVRSELLIGKPMLVCFISEAVLRGKP